MEPDFAVFTGADDRTNYQDLLDLSNDYSVEFGILFSKSRTGQARYPSPKWINGLHSLDLCISAHICGSWARQIAYESKSDIDERMKNFDRIQVNIEPGYDLEKIVAWKEHLQQKHGRPFRVILQTRNKFPEETRIEWLFDASGGRGLEPKSWPEPPQSEDVRIGYAGGIGPDNVEKVLKSIDLDGGFWIDMESKIRNKNDLFDIGFCRQVCDKIFEDESELIVD